ncbi:MAG: hypothetical protein ABIO50_04205, partial [Nitrosospira sp.]
SAPLSAFALNYLTFRAERIQPPISLSLSNAGGGHSRPGTALILPSGPLKPEHDSLARHVSHIGSCRRST